MSDDVTAQNLYASDWAREHLPSYGPAWDRAIGYGVDVTLLLENLAASPTERLRRLQHVADFHAQLRAASRASE